MLIWTFYLKLHKVWSMILCYRITCLWFCNKRFCNKKGHYLCQIPYIQVYTFVCVYICILMYGRRSINFDQSFGWPPWAYFLLVKDPRGLWKVSTAVLIFGPQVHLPRWVRNTFQWQYPPCSSLTRRGSPPPLSRMVALRNFFIFFQFYWDIIDI